MKKILICTLLFLLCALGALGQTPVIASFSCTPATVNSGGSSVCTATLTAPSPGYTAIELSSDNSLATMQWGRPQGGILIHPGQISGTVTVNVGQVPIEQTATITAVILNANTQAEFTLTLEP